MRPLFVEEVVDLPSKASDLLSEILDRFPTKTATLRKVMALGRVIYSNKPQMTAAVMNTKPYTLVFGKPFIEKHTKKDEDLVYLLCHELTHLVLDHFAKDILSEFEEKKLAMKAMHIIVDCQVNASCHHILRDPRYFEFVNRYYKQDVMPYCFFRMDGIPPTDELKSLHQKLYSEDGITNKELIEGLMEWFKQEQDKIDEIVKNLLGNHFEEFGSKSDESQGEGEEGNMPELKEAAAQELSDLLQRPLDEETQKKLEEISGKTAGKGGTLIEKEIQTCRDRIEYAKAVNREISKPRVVSASAKIFQAINDLFPKRSVRTVIPNFHDNRTVAHYYRHKKSPIFNNVPTIGTKVIVPCYVDVSGSQDHVIPHVLPVVSRLKKKVGDVIYCFSTEVSETKITGLSVEKIKTTGGTDFNPVIEHIIKNKFKQALILTDGQAPLSEENIEALKKNNVEIKVGWTVSDPTKYPLEEIAKSTFFVFNQV